MTININRMGSDNLKRETAGRYYVLYTKNEYPLGLRATYMGVLPDEFGEDSKYIFKLYANDELINVPIENFVKKHEYLQNDNEWFAKRALGGFSRRNGYGRYYEEPNNSMNSNSNNSSYAGSNSNGVGSNSNDAGSNSGIDALNEDPVRNSQANDPMSGGTRRQRKKRNLKSKSRKSNRKSRKNRS
jgi:hypothetical protein